MLFSITLIGLIGLGCSVPVIQDENSTAIPSDPKATTTKVFRVVRQVAYTSYQPPVAPSDPTVPAGPYRVARQAAYTSAQPPVVPADPVASTGYRVARQAAYTTQPPVAPSDPSGPSTWLYRVARQVVVFEPQLTVSPIVPETTTGATNYQPIQGDVYNYPAKQPQNPEYQPSLKVPVV